MVLVLDTGAIPARERAEAVRAAMLTATPVCRLVHQDPASPPRARIDLWHFGGAFLWRHEGTGMRMTRTTAHIRRDAPEILAIALQEYGHARRTQADHTLTLGRGDLLLSDLTAPYDYAWTGLGCAAALSIPYDRLGLPVDLVRRAAPKLRASRLLPLVRDHLAGLTAQADMVSQDTQASALGEASITLVRALIASAAREDRHAAAALADTLPAQINAYIDHHLRDPELRPAAIAAAHHISLRQLYRLVQPPQCTLEQWIVARRLAGARSDLAARQEHRRSITDIARSWGFRDPSHFTRRFRAAYGLTPREWRHLTAEEQPQAAAGIYADDQGPNSPR
ncbi:helix-turn-helix domain-containing protein [Streptomyces sp. NPDC060010]|uniref:helix-turn-helix domain-containing protein n=1 Tax=Streptomyces sp. NPDC060010 TaxID=3347036 RepID=UPI0036B0E2F8